MSIRVRKNITKDDERTWNISIPLRLSGYQRRLINSYYGQPGMATLDTCRRYIRDNGLGTLDDLDYMAQQIGMPGQPDYDLDRFSKEQDDEDA